MAIQISGTNVVDNSRNLINVVNINASGIITATVYDATVFAYKNVIDTDIDLNLPYKTAVIYADPGVTVDIESGSTLSVGNGVFFSIIDV